MSIITSNVVAMPIANQVDMIQLPPDAYTSVGDRYTVAVSGPIESTIEIELGSGDISGCNLCNATVRFGNAINADPVMSSFLTATFNVWDGVSVVPFGDGTFRADYDPVIYLTANLPGIPFVTTASVFSASTTADPRFVDLSVVVSTLVPAVTQVPEPHTLELFGIGLFGLGCIWHRARHRNAALL